MASNVMNRSRRSSFMHSWFQGPRPKKPPESRAVQTAPVLRQLVDELGGRCCHGFVETSDDLVAAHKWFVVRAATDNLTGDHPRTDLGAALAAQVTIVIEPPRHPEVRSALAPPRLHLERVR